MLPSLRNLDISQNRIQRIAGPLYNKNLENLNLAKNQINEIGEDILLGLVNLKVLDLRENNLTVFRSFPRSPKLESVQISFNQITDVSGFSNAVGMVTLDLKNNKLTTLPEEVFLMKALKILDLSNNDMQNLPPELGLLKTLNKLQIEGNPLRSIRLAVRQGGTETIKKYLASRITEEDITKRTANDAKSNLIREEFLEKSSNISKIVQLVRQMKNTNGDLDLRGKGLTVEDFTQEILVADKVKSLDISDNKLRSVPPFIEKLGPVSLKINNNMIGSVDVAEIINFSGLRDLELKGNKMQSFCDHINSKQDMMLIQMNFAALTYLDLSQNSLASVPKIVPLIPNLRSLILAYNSIKTLEDLFQEGNVPQLDHLDVGNNCLRDMPVQIYRWQSLSSLVVQNNDIKNFPPELGYLPLKNLNITGNPTVLLKNNMANKGAAVLLDYLKDRVANKGQIENEIAAIRSKKSNFVLPPKKPTDLVEYDFVDPFKKRAVEYQSKQDMKYGEVYEEDLKNMLLKNRSQKMEEERPSPYGSSAMRSPIATPGKGAPMDLENNSQYHDAQARGGRFAHSQQQRPGAAPYEVSRRNDDFGARPVQSIVEDRSIHIPRAMEEERPQVPPQEANRLAKEIDAKIKAIQDKIDNDYTLNKNKVADLKKELTQLKIQRSSLFK